MSKLELASIPVNDERGWHSALEGIPHGFAHTADCCRAIQLTTKAPTRLVFLRRDQTKVVCPISERSFDRYIDVFTPYQFSGFAGNRPDAHFDEDWRAFACGQGWVSGYHAMHPLLPNESYYNALDCAVQNDLYVIDLRPSVESIYSLLDRARRRELRSYRANDQSFSIQPESLETFLLDEYPAFVQRVSASFVFSQGTLQALARAESTLLIGVANKGIVEAVYLFGYTQWAADCLLNVATLAGRRHSTALLWRGMLELRRRGVPWINLGGGVRHDDSIARAKQHFGATRVPFRSIRQIYRYDLFTELCRRAATSAEASGRYFPPYQRPSRRAKLY